MRSTSVYIVTACLKAGPAIVPFVTGRWKDANDRYELLIATHCYEDVRMAEYTINEKTGKLRKVK